MRLLRVFRVLRMISMSARLGQLVRAFLHALQSVAWVGMLMMLVLYMFAVLATSFFQEVDNVPESKISFGTIPRSMLTLIQFAALDDWSIITRDISETGSQPLIWVFVIMWLVLAAIALLNLLTAVFIEALTDSTNKGKIEERELLMQLRKELLLTITDLFHKFDTDDSGTLSMEELDKLFDIFEDPDVKVRFEDAGIEIKEVKEAIAYSDADGSGEIDYEEFLNGITRMDEQTVKCDTLELQSRIRMLQHTEGQLHRQSLSELVQIGQNIHKFTQDMTGRMAKKQKVFAAQFQDALKKC